ELAQPQMPRKLELLRNQGDLPQRGPPRCCGVRVQLVDACRPRARPEHAGGDMEQAALACPVEPQQAGDALLQLEGDIIKSRTDAVADRDAAERRHSVS